MKLKLFALLALGIFLFGCLNTPADSGNVTANQSSNVTIKPIKPVDLKPVNPIQIGKIDSNYFIAKDFITNSSTYMWDGSNLTTINRYANSDCAPGYFELFEIGEPVPCTVMNSSAFYNNSVIYLFGFTSSHGGYGNRDGQIVTQAFTSHRIMVMVKDERVVSSIIDGKWDEVAQEMLPGQN